MWISILTHWVILFYVIYLIKGPIFQIEYELNEFLD